MSESAITLEEVLHRIGFIEKWEARGVAKGKEEGKAETARRALAEGASIEFVQRITGLDLETIKAINSQ